MRRIVCNVAIGAVDDAARGSRPERGHAEHEGHAFVRRHAGGGAAIAMLSRKRGRACTCRHRAPLEQPGMCKSLNACIRKRALFHVLQAPATQMGDAYQLGAHLSTSAHDSIGDGSAGPFSSQASSLESRAGPNGAQPCAQRRAASSSCQDLHTILGQSIRGQLGAPGHTRRPSCCR